MLYLTPIYIWDKAMGYKLVKTKGPMPPHVAIQDGNTNTPPPKVILAEEKMISTIKELSAQRQLKSNELMAAMSGTQKNERSNVEKIQEIIKSILKTRVQIGLCKEDLSTLWERKRVIRQEPGSLDSKKKRAKVVKEEMKGAHAMLKTLEGAMFVQRDELNKLNPKKSDDDVVESDGSSSGYDIT